MTDAQPPDDRKPIERRHLWEFQAVRDALLISMVVGLVWLGYLLSIVTVPLLVALGLAYLVEPLIAWITRTFPRISRSVAVALLMVVISLSVIIALLLTLPVLAKQANQLVKNSDRYVAQARAFATDRDLPEWLRGGLGTLADLLPGKPPEVPQSGSGDPEKDQEKKAGEAEQPDGTSRAPRSETPAGNAAKPEISVPERAPAAAAPTGPLDEARVRALIREELARDQQRGEAPPSGLLQGVAGAGLRVLGYLAVLAGGLIQVAIFALTCGFCFFVFATSFPGVIESGRELVPAAGRERWIDLIGKMDRALSGFIRGRLTVSACLAVMYAVGWTLCGVPHGVLLGLAVGLCSLVPYLAAVGLPLAWVLLAVSLAGAPAGERTGFYFAEGGQGTASIIWWKVLLFPLIVNVVAQAIEDYVLNPLIQGKATNLHPVTILLAAIAGGSLAGLYGMILAVPVAACLKILLQEVLMPKVRDWLAGRTEDPLPGAKPAES